MLCGSCCAPLPPVLSENAGGGGRGGVVSYAVLAVCAVGRVGAPIITLCVCVVGGGVFLHFFFTPHDRGGFRACLVVVLNNCSVAYYIACYNAI